MKRATLALTMVLALVLVGPALAQVTTASLSGKVSDEQGLPLPGATVEAKNLASGFTFRAVTRENGSFLLANLPPGKYEVTVTMSGMKPESQTLEVLLGQTATANFRLTVDQLFVEEVTVVGSKIIDIKS
ncbi:MAG: carboxypeptidase-like regulatory domain-containing protein, partial [Thermoanaerobaculum sp.]